MHRYVAYVHAFMMVKRKMQGSRTTSDGWRILFISGYIPPLARPGMTVPIGTGAGDGGHPRHTSKNVERGRACAHLAGTCSGPSGGPPGQTSGIGSRDDLRRRGGSAPAHPALQPRPLSTTRRLRGAKALVSEAEDGSVTIRANGHVVAGRLDPKDHAQFDPGVVVAHKDLEGQRRTMPTRLARIRLPEKRSTMSGVLLPPP